MLFPQNDIFQDFRWHESFFYFLFLVQRYKSIKKILKPCWSVKKILKPTRASFRSFCRTLQYKPRFAFRDPECHFLKMTFFKTLDDMKVFYFSFLVQRYSSVKKILKPAGVSRKFWSLLGRQELLQDFYSINQDLHFVILNVISLKWLFSRL